MAITPIGGDDISALSMQIAETKARGIEGREEDKEQRMQALSRGIGSSVQSGLQSAGTALAGEIDVQKKREAEELLKSGAQGLQQYAQEVGLDPSDMKGILSMAQNVRDPKAFADLYKMVKTKAEKKAEDSHVAGFAAEMQAMGDIHDDAQYEQAHNKLLTRVTGGGPGAEKRNLAILKEHEENRDRTKTRTRKPGEVTKGIRTLRKEFNAEPKVKSASTILDQSNILERAATDGEFIKKDGSKIRLAQDQALVMTFNKILDPTSVVRESEYARSGASAGLFESLKGWVKGLTEGGANLTNEGRASILKMGRLISETAKIDMFQQMSDYERFGKIEGVSDENLDLINSAFSKHGSDYSEWKQDEKGYEKKYFDRTNELLNEVIGEIEGVHGASGKPSVKTKGKEISFEETIPAKEEAKAKVRRKATSMEEF